MGRINNHSSKAVEGRQSVLAPACQSQDLGLQSTKLFHCFGDADANHDDDDFKKPPFPSSAKLSNHSGGLLSDIMVALQKN